RIRRYEGGRGRSVVDHKRMRREAGFAQSVSGIDGNRADLIIVRPGIPCALRYSRLPTAGGKGVHSDKAAVYPARRGDERAPIPDQIVVARAAVQVRTAVDQLELYRGGVGRGSQQLNCSGLEVRI